MRSYPFRRAYDPGYYTFPLRRDGSCMRHTWQWPNHTTCAFCGAPRPGYGAQVEVRGVATDPPGLRGVVARWWRRTRREVRGG